MLIHLKHPSDSGRSEYVPYCLLPVTSNNKGTISCRGCTRRHGCACCRAPGAEICAAAAAAAASAAAATNVRTLNPGAAGPGRARAVGGVPGARADVHGPGTRPAAGAARDHAARPHVRHGRLPSSPRPGTALITAFVTSVSPGNHRFEPRKVPRITSLAASCFPAWAFGTSMPSSIMKHVVHPARLLYCTACPVRLCWADQHPKPLSI